MHAHASSPSSVPQPPIGASASALDAAPAAAFAHPRLPPDTEARIQEAIAKLGKERRKEPLPERLTKYECVNAPCLMNMACVTDHHSEDIVGMLDAADAHDTGAAGESPTDEMNADGASVFNGEGSASDSVRDGVSAECRQLTLIDQSPLDVWMTNHPGNESAVLSEPVAPGNHRTLRAFLLGKLELFLMNHWSKVMLEEVLREEARNLGKHAKVPTTMKQFRKLTAFLDGEVQFYAACCRPYDRRTVACDHCGKAVWIDNRPRHVFFVRSVRAWLNDVLGVLSLKNAIDQYRKRKPDEGVINDILDGKVAKELQEKGAPHRHSRRFSRQHKDTCDLSWISASLPTGTASSHSRTAPRRPWTLRRSRCSCSRRVSVSSPSCSSPGGA